jgi:hypothetical protein
MFCVSFSCQRANPSRGHRQSVQDVAQGVLGDTLSDLTDIACWDQSATSRQPRRKRTTTQPLRTSKWPRRTQATRPPANPVRFSAWPNSTGKIVSGCFLRDSYLASVVDVTNAVKVCSNGCNTWTLAHLEREPKRTTLVRFVLGAL